MLSKQASRKSILLPGDLAINGAPPAFANLVHVGRPNIGSKERYLALISDMLDRRWLSNNGPLVEEFEAKLAAYLNVRNVVVMCNGTIALEIAVRALNLSGEVIVPSYTFVATAHAVYWQGLTPVFADIDPATHSLDPEAVRRSITPRTSGIIATHLWGQPADIAALESIAAKHDLKLMFDAAHAFGVSSGNRMIGNFGTCEVFSFHATKFMNSLEGGAIATNDDDLAERARLMRNFGFSGRDDEVIYPGTNGKMVEACAAMGIVNLDSIDAIISANQSNREAYKSGLAGIPGLRLFPFDAQERNNYQYIVVEIGSEFGVDREAVIRALNAENVLARRYFWPGCHRMQPYRDLFPWANATLPATNAVAERVVVLPTGTTLSAEDVGLICDVIRTVQREGSPCE